VTAPCAQLPQEKARLPRRRNKQRPVLSLARRDDLERAVRQRPLQYKSVGSVGLEPAVDFCRRSENNRHGLRVDRSNNSIGLRRQKPEQLMFALTGALFGPRIPRQGVHRPAKAKSGRSSFSANHVGVLRGFVSAYSQNEVAGTTQRFRLPSHPRQCGLLTLRMFVTGWPPY
jgi:hypothetical protein